MIVSCCIRLFVVKTALSEFLQMYVGLFHLYLNSLRLKVDNGGNLKCHSFVRDEY